MTECRGGGAEAKRVWLSGGPDLLSLYSQSIYSPGCRYPTSHRITVQNIATTSKIATIIIARERNNIAWERNNYCEGTQ